MEYKDWAAEAIYDEIYKKAKKDGKNFLEKLGKLLDEHIDWDKDAQSNKDKTKGAPKYNKEELKKIKDEMKEAMVSAAQSVGAGNIPGAIQRMISELTEPKMNWREIIQQQIVSTMKSDYTFMKPSRRSWHMDAILPGMMNTDKIDICLALDASGSISEEQCKEFLSEVKGIMDQYQDFTIHLWSFDTKVFNPKVFTPDNMDELEDYKLGSGGGTEFECNWDYMKEEGIEPKKFIMFTDGWPFETWGDEHYCDTVFLINNPYERDIEAPFGLTVQYND
jgi:predicted metal-dependent peptidase